MFCTYLMHDEGARTIMVPRVVHAHNSWGLLGMARFALLNLESAEYPQHWSNLCSTSNLSMT